MNNSPPIRLLASFYQVYPHGAPAYTFRVADRNMWIAAKVEDSGQFWVTAPDLDEDVSFGIKSARVKQSSDSKPLPLWAQYLAGVALILLENQFEVPGARAAIVGDEPPGPRYASSFGLAFAELWYRYNQRTYVPDELVKVMIRAQRVYIDPPNPLIGKNPRD